MDSLHPEAGKNFTVCYEAVFLDGHFGRAGDRYDDRVPVSVGQRSFSMLAI